jgi:hypothetical protein
VKRKLSEKSEKKVKKTKKSEKSEKIDLTFACFASQQKLLNLSKAKNLKRKKYHHRSQL